MYPQSVHTVVQTCIHRLVFSCSIVLAKFLLYQKNNMNGGGGDGEDNDDNLSCTRRSYIVINATFLRQLLLLLLLLSNIPHRCSHHICNTNYWLSIRINEWMNEWIIRCWLMHACMQILVHVVIHRHINS